MKRTPSKYKQVLIVRKDLGMDAGKLGAQTAHAMHLALFGDVRPVPGAALKDELVFVVKGAAAHWLQEDFPKIILEVYSEKELLALHVQAQAANLPCGLVVDNGWTVFKNQKTPTVVGIGPADAAAINRITGHLQKYTSAETLT
jgi:PTH2 family peptidyl-tRNA hydrolase